MYLLAVLLGAIVDYCPYQARVSEYIQYVYNKLKLKNWTGFLRHIWNTEGFKSSKANDWRAVEWLLDHARDRDVVKRAYRLLADSGFYGDDIRSFMCINKVPDEKDRLKMNRMGLQAINQLKESTGKYLDELRFCKGINAGRYALVLSEMYQIDEQHLSANGESTMGAETQRRIQQLQDSLDALDDFWTKKLPPFVGCSNADLITAELRITSYIMRGLSQNDASQPQLSPDHSLRFPNRQTRHPNPNHRSIVLSPFLGPNNPHLKQRARRGLYRGGLSLHYHLNNAAPIKSASLAILLSSLYEIATDLKQRVPGTLPEILSVPQYPDPISVQVIIDGDVPRTHYFDSNAICRSDGLLAGLVSLLNKRSTTSGSPQSEHNEYYCAAIMCEIAPMLIHEWIITHSGESGLNRYEIPSSWPSYSHWHCPWPRKFPSPYPVPNPYLDCLIVRQLLEIMCFTTIHVNHFGKHELPGSSVRALLSRTISTESCSEATRYLCSRPKLLRNWVEAIGNAPSCVGCHQADDYLSPLSTLLVRLLARNLGIEENNDPLSCLMQRDHDADEQDKCVALRLETVLAAMARIADSDCADSVPLLLRQIATSLEINAPLECFTKLQGFTYLCNIGAYDNCKDLVANIIMSLVPRLLIQSPPRKPWSPGNFLEATKLEGEAFSGFLGAISFLFDCPRFARGNHRQILQETMRIIENQLQSEIDDQTYKQLEDGVIHKLKIVLQNIVDSSKSMATGDTEAESKAARILGEINGVSRDIEHPDLSSGDSAIPNIEKHGGMRNVTQT